MSIRTGALVFTLISSGLLAVGPLTPDEEALLKPISAESLKGHVSFLASDLLEGRDTPSRGLDIAAEYIATRFRSVGLEPASDNGYFQTAKYQTVLQPKEGFELTVQLGGKDWKVDRDKATIQALHAAEINVTSLFKADVNSIESVQPGQIEGKAVVWTLPGNLFSMPDAERAAVLPKIRAGMKLLEASKAALILTTGYGPGTTSGARLVEATDESAGAPPGIYVRDRDVARALDDLPDGEATGSVVAKIPAPQVAPATLKNVVGILKGSDPDLSKTYVLVTAHYDHIGIRANEEGDRINNGANDDASGTSSVLEVAASLAKAPHRPKRSIVFMTYFGEEKGLYGSRFYGRHPIFPLKQTVANLNLEQLGRTDDTEGSTAGKLTASGFDYTTIGEVLTESGKLTGIETWFHEKNSDAFFGRSDNQSLADAGVPAITLAGAWIFPDYHKPGDEWDKLDYANMEKLDKTIALAVWRIANNPVAPKWIDTNPKTEKYVKAYQTLHAGE